MFIKQGDANVLRRSSMSWGISDVMGLGSSGRIGVQKWILLQGVVSV